MFAVCGAGVVPAAHGQARQPQLKVDGQVHVWPGSVPIPNVNSLEWESELVSFFHRQGYFLAVVDSVTSQGDQVFVVRGPAALLEEVRVLVEGEEGGGASTDGVGRGEVDAGNRGVISGENAGNSGVISGENAGNGGVISGFDGRVTGLVPGDTLSSANIEAGLVNLLTWLSDRGHLAATAQVGMIERVEAGETDERGESGGAGQRGESGGAGKRGEPGAAGQRGESGAATGSPLYRLEYQVEPGPELPILGLELEGSARTDESRLNKIVKVPPNAYTKDARERVARELASLDIFSALGTPRLEIVSDSGAVIVIPVEEMPPGSFDLALGYLPPEGGVGNGTVVGQGSIDLHNAFGGGRSFQIRLDRRPGSASSVLVNASDPFVAGTPFRVGLQFKGLQQDSTWSSTGYGASLAYRFRGDMRLGVRYSRESVRPGPAGLALVGERQRIARSNAGFWGIEVELGGVDNPSSPRSGIVMESLFERGTRETSRRERVEEGAGEETIVQRNRVERVSLSIRSYWSPLERFTASVGADASLQKADLYDESDLFRLGGASSLRGYDEDRFRGNIVGRAVLELRGHIDLLSFGFLFLDMGYVERPRMGQIPATTGWHPGYGLGLQFESAVGLMNLSYAMSPDDALSRGRIHVGVSFGL